MVRLKLASVLTVLLVAAAFLQRPARAAGSLTIDDVFPAALPAYVTGGVKGPGGDARSGTVFALATGMYVDARPSSLAYALRGSPLVPDFDMTMRFLVGGRDGTAPEKIVFVLKAQEPRYPVTCCTGDSSQMHARSGLWLVYDLGGYVWSLYREQDYVTVTTPLASTPLFINLNLTHDLRFVSASGRLDVFIDGAPLLGAATGSLAPGLMGVMTTRVDLILYSILLRVDCSDPTLPDADGDGTPDSCDNCPMTPNPTQHDADGDALADACDRCPHDPLHDAEQDAVCGDVDNCPSVANTDQTDFDHDGQGDACDLDDGLLVLSLPDTQQITWQTDPAYDSYNLYTGDLAVLKSTGVYTQTPGSSPVVQRFCNMTSNSIFWSTAPARGQAIVYLVSGNRNFVESTLGTDSTGRERPNDNPCPHLHPVISINGDAGFTTANGVVGGSGTDADPYRIEGWGIDTSGAFAGITVANTTVAFVIRNVSILGSVSYGVHLDNVARGRIEGVTLVGVASIGIFAQGSRNVVVDGNKVASFGAGIWIDSSSDVTISRNDVSGGRQGIVLSSTLRAAVQRNNLLNNATQAQDDGSGNAWNADYPAGGNYWTDYMGTDACGGPLQDDCAAGPDGFGDLPYVIDPDSLDLYPLMIKPGSESDVTPPTVAIAAPNNGTTVTFASVTVSGNAADAGSGLRRVDVRLNGGPWTIATGTVAWSAPVVLAPGPNLIEVLSLDHAGNVSTVAGMTVTYVVPVIVVATTTNKSIYTPGQTVGITVTVTNLSTAAVTLHFPTSCEAFFRVETPSGSILYDLKAHVDCFFAFTELTLQPGQSELYSFAWSPLDDAGHPVPVPGDYVVRGYLDATESVPTGITTISIVTPRVDITVRTDRTLYALDETVQVAVTLTNRTAQVVTLHLPDACLLFFRVETPQGSPVYDLRFHAVCPAVLTTLTLQPGQSSNGTFGWPLTTDTGQPVPAAAEYVIVGFSNSFESVPEGRTRIQVK